MAAGFAAGITPTQCAVMLKVNRGAAPRIFAYFRCAEAAKGRELRADAVFHGTEEAPAEVEVGEAVDRKKHEKDATGQLQGTWHYAFFGVRLRGSRRSVVYPIAPMTRKRKRP